ncbi:baseplate protein J [Chrysosporum ovalisporum ANA283AFssAo]|uniref:baseplate protein J n=1 Tax=Umezakia ovalisporum TaxID=75695 RepID=UPI002476BE02|nr:baseplate protein J [Umezakia ovalisporum]MDH6103357.1 baseplate protein J [Umezakia ovalisporum ANA283AFssAo]
MTLPLPNLDDRTYTDLVQEAIGLIPSEAPEWTDHNPSDTGIILIELFAWLTEMVLYRTNQITNRNQAAFLTLLQGKPYELQEGKSTSQQNAILQAEIQKTLAQIRQRYRAVTATDFEQIILFDWLQTKTAACWGEAAIMARVNCLPERDLENADINQLVEAHITLVVLPKIQTPDTEIIKKTIKKFLDQRRLISTRLHIVEPNYVNVKVAVTLYLHDSASYQAVQTEAKHRLTGFFNPFPCAEYWHNQGYPFGRDIYVSELYELFDHLPGVDYVEQIHISEFEAHRRQINAQNQLTAISLQENELVTLEIGEITTMQRLGDKWKKND